MTQLPLDAADRSRVLHALAEQIHQVEGARWQAGSGEVVSSGSETLDALLPERGFRRGALVEWLGAEPGCGAATLSLWVARQALAGGGALVVIDRARRFYPPAAITLGIVPEQLLVVRPSSVQDQDWALDQVLRSRGVAVAWCAVERADDGMLRRWQLAAEESGVLGFLLRGPQARGEPAWAELRLGIRPKPAPVGQSGRVRRVRVELLRSRLGPVGKAVELELPEANFSEWAAAGPGRRDVHHETGSLHLAPSVAAATARRRARGA